VASRKGNHPMSKSINQGTLGALFGIATATLL
jgi:hypothetical protein